MSKYKMVVINNTYSTISQRLYEIKPYLHSFPVSVINISKSELETYSILDLETMRDNKLNTILSSN